jgi:hypothetical protein
MDALGTPTPSQALKAAVAEGSSTATPVPGSLRR